MSDFSYSDYLSKLNELEKKNAPKELFFEGDISLLTKGTRVSVVGSRKVSDLGIRRTRILTESLIKKGIIVVSGLALGVDTVAHETAIHLNGQTISVLGTPLDKTYPAKNKELLKQIKTNHLAISQFPVGYPSGKQNFPRRNKTMALISDATVIVEASENSGTRHQGWEALRLGRLLFLLESVVTNPSLTWPKEMIKYGAQVLSRENLQEALDDIPNFTSNIEIAF